MWTSKGRECSGRRQGGISVREDCTAERAKKADNDGENGPGYSTYNLIYKTVPVIAELDTNFVHNI
jgi:hypothetical protein